MAKKYEPSAPLVSWLALNEALMSGDLALAQGLLKEEKANKKRKQFLLRLHSRINKLRADEERSSILAACDEQDKGAKK